ncbi:hypothetical protein T492DRAFT_1020823 [Pavlovales sp. CCMP2436]|nr:hypothetical protein T492DRAFT_1020823 [Pavlovales sp. CCMP2436]
MNDLTNIQLDPADPDMLAAAHMLPSMSMSVQKKKACYVGVRHHGECRTNPWEARCRAGGKKHNLGYFASAEKAGRAYDLFARQYGRKLNFPDDQAHYSPPESGARDQPAAEPRTARTVKRVLEPSHAHFNVQTGMRVLHELQVGPRLDATAASRRGTLDDDGDVTPTEGEHGTKRSKVLVRLQPEGVVGGQDAELRRPGRRVLDFRPLEQARSLGAHRDIGPLPNWSGAAHPAAQAANEVEARVSGADAHALALPSHVDAAWSSTPCAGIELARDACRTHGASGGDRESFHFVGAPCEPSSASAVEDMHAASSLLVLSGLVA